MTDPLGLMNPAGGIRPSAPMRPGAGGAAGSSDFKDLLMKNIEQVNKLQQDADHAIEDLATGRRDDVDGVLIAKQKADLAFQLLLQVRNKMVDAYQEIKQMRV
ncbi:MAG: flagellar hook-basal body complex protein FliE [Planctomycetota bacterium]|nr:flagellar hook-basal body complex protein FliE [Planctomycetota bacterium]